MSGLSARTWESHRVNEAKEFVFQFQRFDFEILDSEKLLTSAREVLATEVPREGHSYPRELGSNVDAIDVHLAAWGFDRMQAVPGVRLLARSGSTAAYDLSEAEYEDSFNDPFLWGVTDDEDDD